MWKAKPLLTRLIGDNTWAPCGIMMSPNDYELIADSARFLKRPANSSAAAAASASSAEDVRNSGTGESPPQDAEKEHANGSRGPVQTIETDHNQLVETIKDKGKGKEMDGAEQQPGVDGTSIKDKPDGDGNTNGEPQTETSGKDKGAANDAPTKAVEDVEMVEASVLEGQQDAAAQEASQPKDSHADVVDDSLSADDPFIHPLFLPPRSAQPDRDLGLPDQEAEDVRRLLQLYVQKQEEVCRGTKKLYEGLLQADRYRKTVWQWAKAEAHAGPNRDMSDGEDWYDKEEWGLTEDLKKGEDEVEEDTTQTQKKTRNRK